MARITAEDYRNIASPVHPRVSPDGERVAYVQSVPADGDSYDTSVWVAAADGSDQKRIATDATEPRWGPNGDRIAFVRPDEFGIPQLHVVDADGREPERVTNVAGGVTGFVITYVPPPSFAWSPDGSKIAFVQPTTAEQRAQTQDLERGDEWEPDPSPDPRVIKRIRYRSQTVYKDGKRTHVYVLDLETGEIERVTEGEFDHSDPDWGDDDSVYYLSQRGEDPDQSVEFQILRYDRSTGNEHQVTETTGRIPEPPTISVASDGRVAYTSMPTENMALRQREIQVYDPSTDETVTPTEPMDRTLGRQKVLDWDEDEDVLYFLTPDRGKVVVRKVRADAGEPPEVVVEDGHISDASVAGGTVAFTQTHWDHPGDLFAADVGDGDLRRLTNLNEALLDDRDVSEPEELAFESDGEEIQGWLLTPPDFDPDESYPLIVQIHGGPHDMWSNAGSMWHEFQMQAAHGYAVFWCNPRGSTGYGEAFVSAIHDDWGETTMTDIEAGVDHVAEREYVDADDAFVTGGSFGGYMVGWIVGHTDRFNGAIAQRGVYDFSSFYGSTDVFRLVDDTYDTVPWEDPDRLWEASPVAYVDDVSTPTLVIHSEDDFCVPVNNAEMYFAFLKRTGTTTEFVRYPDEGHELSRSGAPDHVVDRLERIVDWCDRFSTR